MHRLLTLCLLVAWIGCTSEDPEPATTPDVVERAELPGPDTGDEPNAAEATDTGEEPDRQAARVYGPLRRATGQ